MRYGFGMTVLFLLVVTGCSKDNLAAPTDDNSQEVLEIVSRNGQIGVVSDTLSSELVVRFFLLTNDGKRKPLSGVTVQFSTQAGDGMPTSESVETDGYGEAATKWVMGSTVASQQLRAATLQVDNSESHSVSFDTAGPLFSTSKAR